MNIPLYIIRGTGMGIDGTIVTIVENMGDYSVVSPPNLPDPITNIMVKTKCLQQIGKDNKTFLYQLTVRKINEDPIGDGHDGDIRTLTISKCIRDVDLSTIIEFLDKTLSPILRMEQ